ncbi:MAG: hypothetical protein GXO65_03945 [Euryarchaeota archaeon]|nr:hypothetical protein [Euryarchaeota archaeon]
MAGELIRHGVDVYMPCVDDQAIDLVLRAECPTGIRYYDVQVKRVKGYNRIVGVKSTEGRQGKYILVIHYRHDNKPDEFFYLTQEQITRHHIMGSEWGDLVFNKPEREKYREQTLSQLAKKILDGKI